MKMGNNTLIIFAIILALVHAEDVLLKCDKFDSVTGESFCMVSGLIVSHSQNVKIQSYAMADLTNFMKFYESRLLYVPFKLFDVFPGLISLDVSFTEILDVPRNTFGAAKNLTILNMSHNNITQITTSAFVGANGLLRLDLSHNQLSEINDFAFRGLGILDKLQLSYNRLRHINKDIFEENTYLENISLDNNLIEYIEPEVFNRLRRIRDVNLSSNRIVRFHPNSFQGAYGLESLMLSANRLTEFNLANKNILTLLNLDYNNLTSILINGTKFVSATDNKITNITAIHTVFLENLLLKNNSITDIKNITNFTSLLVLDLSYNAIGPLNVTTFDRVKRLRKLYLRATGIRYLNFGVFSKLTYLELLDLAFNNLTDMNLDVFVPYLSNLEQFFIDGNNLTEIQGKHTFSLAFKHLHKLGISRNRFNCTYLHALLIPPNLSHWVVLEIEPEQSDAEVSHIRDVSCVSSVKESLQIAERNFLAVSEIQRVLQQSMDILRQHEHRLEIYLMILKIALLAMICLAAVIAVSYFWRVRRSENFSRRGGSIVFHSNATVNTNIGH